MIEHLSKADAAARQLAASIRMYFQDADPLAVHTVAGAAHRLLHDLSLQNGAPSRDRAPTRSEHSQHTDFVSRMVREAINFLKHADHDPDASLSFNTDWTDFLLYDAIHLHLSLAKRLTDESTFFLMWITSKYPTVRLLDDLTEGRIEELRRLFPVLGSTDTQKCTFLTALENRRNPKGPG